MRVRDEQNETYREIPETNAEDDSAGHASYILKVSQSMDASDKSRRLKNQHLISENR